jgi:hypothetical protein
MSEWGRKKSVEEKIEKKNLFFAFFDDFHLICLPHPPFLAVFSLSLLLSLSLHSLHLSQAVSITQR